MSDGSSKEQAQKYIQTLLLWMTKNDASDLFILAGFPPAVKIHGELIPIPDAPRIMPEQSHLLTTSVMNSIQYAEFENTKECNFAISISGIGRFRVNALQQRASSGMVIRVIRTSIPKLHDLGVPALLGELSMTKRGLLIMVGATGSGKSTTLAAMIDHRNENSKGHIITIEDPIEFTHNHKKCIITQREVGVDTDSWGAALKNTLRQAPDVIFMGEIRDRETMEYALQFAETGHLCMATLHANNANQAIDRIIHFFETSRHNQLFMDLSLNLQAIIAQQLIPTPDGKGRRAAIEILLNSQLISDYIRKGEVHEIKDVMTRSRESGMQTLDQALFDLYEQGEITYKEAILHADSPNDLRLKIKLSNKNGTANLDEGADSLSLDIT